MNSYYAFTYYSDFRRAVSAAIDYDRIVSEIYGNFAASPKKIYNPDFYEMQYVSPRSLDLMSANLILDDMGFGNRDSEGFRTNKRGKRISLKLIVCNESTVKAELANAVAEMLKEAGIEVNVSALSYGSFMTALENGNYDLYIAEMRLGADMDFTKILTPYEYQSIDSEYINYGFSSSEKLYFSWLGFMSGTVTPSEFASVFEDSMPFAPLCYTKGCAIFNRDLPFSLYGTDFDMFYNILEWKIE
jgi:ABC-type transport system substrate-binding protein